MDRLAGALAVFTAGLGQQQPWGPAGDWLSKRSLG